MSGAAASTDQADQPTEASMEDAKKLMAQFHMDSGEDVAGGVSVAQKKSDQITSKPLTEPELAMLNALRGSGPVRELGLHGELELSFLARLHVSVGHTAEMDVESNAARDVIRCLYARKFELDRAAALFHSYTQFLLDHGAVNRRFRMKGSPRDEAIHGKFYHKGFYDVSGHPIIYCEAKLHVANEFSLESTCALLAANMDCMTANEPQGARDGLVWVVDMAGYGWANVDWRGEEVMGKMIQDAYPARLRAMYMLNSPWWMRFLMSVMSLFMKAKFMSKFVIIDKIEDLAEHLGGLDKIPAQMGGTLRVDHSALAAELEKETERMIAK